MIHLFQFITGIRLGQSLGLLPGSIPGLKGILFSPLLHSQNGWGHILSNTPPLFVLTSMLLFFYPRVGQKAFWTIYLLAGALLWVFGIFTRIGHYDYHIGASGVIYGLVAFIFWSGIFRKNVKSIALALLVLFFYGSLFFGILPGQTGVSWEGHLMGALAGILTAFWFKSSIEDDEKKEIPSWDREEQTPPRHFFQEDVFTKRKEERQNDPLDPNNLPKWLQ